MCMAHNELKCMTSATAMAYVASTNARIFAANAVSKLLLAFIVEAMRFPPVAHRTYPRVAAAF